MGFTPVNGIKPDANRGGGTVPKRTKKSAFMLAKIPNPRPLQGVTASQLQPQQSNPYAYAQQRGRANPALDSSFLKRPVRSPPRPARQHVSDLCETPTLYPSATEFSDPDLYLSSLKEFEKYGMVKVVPPDHWLPPLALDTELFTFRSKHQLINQTVSDADLRAEFNAALRYFHDKSPKRSIYKIPLIHKRPLNMYLLHRSVQLRGGLNEVSRKKLWQQIGRDLGYSGKIMSSLSTSLRNSYQKFLAPFDDYLRGNGVNLSSSPRVVRYKIEPDATPKQGEIKLPCGILITMDYTSPDWHADKFPFISNSHTRRDKQPTSKWMEGKYSPLHSANDQDASYNLKQFQIKATSFQDTYFQSPVNEEEAENEYWRLLSTPGECLDVEYGYSMTNASGFKHDWKNPWNFNLISTVDGSYLRYIDNSRMSKPKLDVGMLFASKSWASEPYFGSKLSISHLGATRTWYCVPPQQFESMCTLVSVRNNEYMATPAQLQKKNICCYVADQRPGEIIIIFPKSWHSHFNHGFNLNESVNFLPRDWLETGKLAMQYYRDLKLPAPFSLEQLILDATHCNNCDLLVYIKHELEEMYAREKSYSFTRTSLPFQSNVCCKTNQELILSWVETSEGPMDPRFAREGVIHTAYKDVDSFFKALIDETAEKLKRTEDYIRKACQTLAISHRAHRDTLTNLVQEGLDTNKCRTVQTLLSTQVRLTDELSSSIQCEGKIMLDVLQESLKKYQHLICRDAKLDALVAIEASYEDFLTELARFVENPVDAIKQLEVFFDRLHKLEVLSPIQDILLKCWNNIIWANKMTSALAAQPILFLHHLDAFIIDAARAGIAQDSALVKSLEERKQSGIALNARAERVAFWEKVDPKELDSILEQALSVPINEQVYSRLQLYKSVHDCIEQLTNADVSKRPRLHEASKFRVINAQIGAAVMHCEKWLHAFGHPDQMMVQLQAASLNSPINCIMQVSIQAILQLFSQMDYLQVIPDNFEAFMHSRKLLHDIMSTGDNQRLMRYGFA